MNNEAYNNCESGYIAEIGQFSDGTIPVVDPVLPKPRLRKPIDLDTPIPE